MVVSGKIVGASGPLNNTVVLTEILKWKAELE